MDKARIRVRLRRVRVRLGLVRDRVCAWDMSMEPGQLVGRAPDS